jgi:MerR, DNA binding
MVQTLDLPATGGRACPISASVNSRSAPASPSTPFVTTSATSCWPQRAGSPRATALGFTLEDIRGLLSLSAERNVAKVKRAAEGKLADVEQRIVELQRIRQGLRTLITACPGHGRAEDCPILNALTQENPR